MNKRASNFKDLTGQRFGRLTVIKFVFKDKNSCKYYLCVCRCGNETSVSGGNLKNGHTKSCGCLKIEMSLQRFKTHGLSKTNFYRKYHHAKNRCLNKNVKNYNDYGGRGIKFLWKSFEKFKKDMYPSYLRHCKKFGIKETTLERKNVNGNYCKENCCFATKKIQANNKRNNNFITYNGKRQTTAQWAKELNINYKLLYQKINRDKKPLNYIMKLN